MQRRNTNQREIILNTVRELRTHLSASDIYDHINVKYPSLSRGTIYRNLDILSSLGEIRKIEVPNGPDRYDFTLEDHYHLRCLNCDGIFDVDMDSLNLEKNIKNTNGFKVLSYDILFKGICPDCQKTSERIAYE